MKKVLFPMLCMASLISASGLVSCTGNQQPKESQQVISDSMATVVKDSIARTEPMKTEEGNKADIKMITEFYGYVFGLDEKEMNEAILDKYLTPELKKSLWTEDYDGCYEFWKFRTSAQDGNPDSEEGTAVKSVEPQGDGWYEVVYSDEGWPGTTRVRVEDGKIAEYKADKSWNSEAE